MNDPCLTSFLNVDVFTTNEPVNVSQSLTSFLKITRGCCQPRFFLPGLQCCFSRAKGAGGIPVN